MDEQKERKSWLPGGLWECDSWHANFNVKLGESDDFDLCPHAIMIGRDDPRFEVSTSHDGRDISWAKQWVIPRAAVQYNEGGHCSTGICIDCILDAERNGLLILPPEDHAASQP